MLLNISVFVISGLIGQFTPVLALYGPFLVDVPLNRDITHFVISTSSARSVDILLLSF